jgi:hypothetical protein
MDVSPMAAPFNPERISAEGSGPVVDPSASCMAAGAHTPRRQQRCSFFNVE